MNLTPEQIAAKARLQRPELADWKDIQIVLQALDSIAAENEKLLTENTQKQEALEVGRRMEECLRDANTDFVELDHWRNEYLCKTNAALSSTSSSWLAKVKADAVRTAADKYDSVVTEFVSVHELRRYANSIEAGKDK